VHRDGVQRALERDDRRAEEEVAERAVFRSAGGADDHVEVTRFLRGHGGLDYPEEEVGAERAVVCLVDDDRAERRGEGRPPVVAAQHVDEHPGGREPDVVGIPLLAGFRRGHGHREEPRLRADDRAEAIVGEVSGEHRGLAGAWRRGDKDNPIVLEIIEDCTNVVRDRRCLGLGFRRNAGCHAWKLQEATTRGTHGCAASNSFVEWIENRNTTERDVDSESGFPSRCRAESNM